MVRHHITHYNHKVYWECLYPKAQRGSRLAFFRMKRMESFSGAQMGVICGGGGAEYAGPPVLPHGLAGIIISPYVKVGRNVTIFHRVTIGQDHQGKAPVIGDDVLIGTGAVLIGDIVVGDHARIGANVFCTKSIPPNTTIIAPEFAIKKTG